MPEDIEPAPDTAALGRWLDENGAPGAGEHRCSNCSPADRRTSCTGSTRRQADGAADAGRRRATPPGSTACGGSSGWCAALKGTDVPHAELIAGRRPATCSASRST